MIQASFSIRSGEKPHRACRLDGAIGELRRQPRSACGAGLLFDMVEDSVVVLVLLLPIVEELVSLLVAGALVCALVLGFWLLVSVLVPDVCAMDTPPAMAAATASVVSAFRVAFIVFTPWVRATWALGSWKKNAGGCQLVFNLGLPYSEESGDMAAGPVGPALSRYASSWAASATVRKELQGFLAPALDLQGWIGAFATEGDVLVRRKPIGVRTDQRGRRWVAVELMWQWVLVGHGKLPVRWG
jgi:hypothetical protein